MAAVVSSIPTPTLRPYVPTQDRERVRSILALVLVALVAAEMLGLGLLTWQAINRTPPNPDFEKHFAVIKDIAALLLTPTIALASAVMGFYYGAKEEG